jgi:hypothetical protein
LRCMPSNAQAALRGAENPVKFRSLTPIDSVAPMDNRLPDRKPGGS